MPIQSTQELLLYELKAIENAEQQVSEMLQGQMAELEDPQLEKLIELRLTQGERLLQQVRESIEDLDGAGDGQENAAARGLIEEQKKLLDEVQSPELTQAALIAGVQKIEHYCIAAWGTVKALGREMGEEELEEFMQQALDEGHQLDRELTELAESRINPAAMEEDEEDEDDEDDDEDDDDDDAEDDEDEQDEEEEAGAPAQSEKVAAGSRTGSGSKPAQGSDLKAREYKDKGGNIHHHTRKSVKRGS